MIPSIRVFSRAGQKGKVWYCEWRENGQRRKRSFGRGQQGKAKAEAFKRRLQARFAGGLGASEENAPAKSLRPEWDTCRQELEAAMRADNMRPGTINDYLSNFDILRGQFKHLKSPADITAEQARKYKQKRAKKLKPVSLKNDLRTLKAIFNKWLKRECGLLTVNPFADVSLPKVDDPEIRIITVEEAQRVVDHFADWKLPLTYFRVLAVTGWRALETASLPADHVGEDGRVEIAGKDNKTRTGKTQYIPPQLRQDVAACMADGWAFGRFHAELKARSLPHHAARCRDTFNPERLVRWMQDEILKLQGDSEDRFTLHDLRRTAISGLIDSGVGEQDVSLLVGCLPATIRKHYLQRHADAVARRAAEKRGIRVEAPAKEETHDQRVLKVLMGVPDLKLLDDAA